MTRPINKKKFAFPLIGVVFLLVLIAAAFVRLPTYINKNNVDSAAVIQPYHTISPSVDSEELYAYELHKRTTPQDVLPEYCAIIRQLNPDKDDYKAYCKTVISDIVHTVGSDKIVVYIYDSNEAYELYETKFLQHYSNLDTAEMGKVDEHLVATYSGISQWGEDCASSYHLSFFESAHNGRAEAETFRPQ